MLRLGWTVDLPRLYRAKPGIGHSRTRYAGTHLLCDNPMRDCSTPNQCDHSNVDVIHVVIRSWVTELLFCFVDKCEMFSLMCWMDVVKANWLTIEIIWVNLKNVTLISFKLHVIISRLWIESAEIEWAICWVIVKAVCGWTLVIEWVDDDVLDDCVIEWVDGSVLDDCVKHGQC